MVPNQLKKKIGLYARFFFFFFYHFNNSCCYDAMYRCNHCIVFWPPAITPAATIILNPGLNKGRDQPQPNPRTWRYRVSWPLRSRVESLVQKARGGRIPILLVSILSAKKNVRKKIQQLLIWTSSDWWGYLLKDCTLHILLSLTSLHSLTDESLLDITLFHWKQTHQRMDTNQPNHYAKISHSFHFPLYNPPLKLPFPTK